jgi:flagellar M-ring protein FliF
MLEEVLGPSKAIARVSTEIDFQQIDITEERYDPNTILRSEQKNTERSSNASGTTMAKEGKVEIPSGTNTPKVSTAPPQPFNNNSSERQHEIRNYEISRINKHVKNSSGQIKRVSVAVIVDGIYEEGKDSKSNKVKKYVPRSQDEMKNFENIVKKAIGYSEQRGDQVEVINMPFYGSVNEEENIADKKTPWWQEYSSIAFKPIVSLVLVLLFILFVVRPVLKKKILSVGTEGLLPQPSTPQMIPREVTQEVAQKEMRTPAALNIKDQTIKLIQEDPPRTVGIVKGWIREKE